jgi:uncharacterized protein YjbJ (UPF0337 family)
MNKDRVEGKLKDVAGRVERQAGEWADDPKMQVKGAAKQAEGKAQNAIGKAEDATKKAVKNAQDNAQDDNEEVELREERARAKG